MTDELPEMFDRVTPPAPPALRPRVLAAVDRELAPRGKPVWERAMEIGVAACLVFGIGLNVWQWQSGTDWQQRVNRTSVELAATGGHAGDVASSDAQVDQLIRDRLAMLAPPPEPQAPLLKQYEQLLKELTDHGSG
ncbi:MAG: hypothetical protein WD468_03045 [Pirellulales bacterium]